jgi:hypothetical protein
MKRSIVIILLIITANGWAQGVLEPVVSLYHLLNYPFYAINDLE